MKMLYFGEGDSKELKTLLDFLIFNLSLDIKYLRNLITRNNITAIHKAIRSILLISSSTSILQKIIITYS